MACGPSLSARRAWIEILRPSRVGKNPVVALRKESVDRNARLPVMPSAEGMVALRKESVDRNVPALKLIAYLNVALRKESVDRNMGTI